MRITRSLIAVAGGFVMAGLSTTAVAGGSYCNSAGTACNPGVAVTSSPYVSQPMGMHYGQPYDYLDTVSYNQTPQVNVMRVQTGAPSATLSSAPNSYWGGCGGSTVTCAAPTFAAPAPVYRAPMPVMAAPVVQAPRTYVASQDYNPANFAPRQYGDNTFVPGIAHIPTSIVDRSPANRDAALMSGRAVPQTVNYGGMVSAPIAPSVSSYGGVSMPGTGTYGASAYTVSMPGTGTYSGSTQPAMGGTSVGGGWNKVSGPTVVDGMIATEILCKQPEPVRQQAYQVVRPIVAVPYPVPVRVDNRCAAPVRGQNVRHAKANSRYGNVWSR